jgi:hypothetical protein
MRRIILIAILAASVGAESWAVPLGDCQLQRIPGRPSAARQDECYLGYYNICSGWVYARVAYCYGNFDEAPVGPSYGTVFDLSDCPSDCRHLQEVWWAQRLFHLRSSVDVEIYFADESNCPTGPPIAGVYRALDIGNWQYADFGGVPLCGPDQQGTDKFIVMITMHCQSAFGCGFSPLCDAHPLNIEVGCETEWRCSGHSYMFQNAVSYCDIYGEPAPLWISGPGYGCTDYPTVPPWCFHNFYDTGCFLEWLIDCYISCEGPTETEKDSWSEIKALYK